MSVDPLSYWNSKNEAEAVTEAAQISSNASDRALDLSTRIYNEAKADYAPWQGVSTNALNELAYGTGIGTVPTDYKGTGGEKGYLNKAYDPASYKEDPGYQFRLSEGIKALDRSASAKGNLLSGSALKGITQFGQDMGSQEYSNAYNRYMSERDRKYNQVSAIAGFGPAANSGATQSGQSYAGNAGDLLMGNAATQGNAGMKIANIRSTMYKDYASGAGEAAQYFGGMYGGGGGR